MRNDARPVGSESEQQSPIPHDRTPSKDRPSREEVIKGKPDERNTDPTMPADESTLNTKI